MNNSHDEIKKLLKASRSMLSNTWSNLQNEEIKSKYNIISEQVGIEGSSVVDKMNITKSVVDRIDDDVKTKEDKSQYKNNVEWSGKIIDFDIDFFFSIGEENGMYINGEMIKTDQSFLELLEKLKVFYEKFKSKWSKILASRKKTKKENEE